MKRITATMNLPALAAHPSGMPGNDRQKFLNDSQFNVSSKPYVVDEGRPGKVWHMCSRMRDVHIKSKICQDPIVSTNTPGLNAKGLIGKLNEHEGMREPVEVKKEEKSDQQETLDQLKRPREQNNRDTLAVISEATQAQESIIVDMTVVPIVSQPIVRSISSNDGCPAVTTSEALHLLSFRTINLDLKSTNSQFGYGRAYPSHHIAEVIGSDFQEFKRSYKRAELKFTELILERQRLRAMLRRLRDRYLEVGGNVADEDYAMMTRAVDAHTPNAGQETGELTEDQLKVVRETWRSEIGGKLVFKYKKFRPIDFGKRTRAYERKTNDLNYQGGILAWDVYDAAEAIRQLKSEANPPCAIALSAVPARVYRIFSFSPDVTMTGSYL